MADEAKRAGVHWLLPLPVRALVVAGDRTLVAALQQRFTPLCRFEVAQSLRQADMRMGLASTPFDAMIVEGEVTDGHGLDWLRRLRDQGESIRAALVTAPGGVTGEHAAAIGAWLVERTMDGDRSLTGLRTFLERVATEHIVRQLLRRYGEERRFTPEEHAVLESALWFEGALLPVALGTDEETTDALRASVRDKAGVASVQSALVAALVRGCLESFNGSGFDD